MLSAEENDTLTRTGPGTAMGGLLRRYWQPILLRDELPDRRPAKDVKIMGEDLVVFRDEQGRYGSLARRCSHRSADLSFGRLEDGGLRCAYHGWLYDVEGRCLEQPAEPEGSTYAAKIVHPAYPCREHNGIVYAYMGGGAPPLFPAFDWNVAPEEHVFVFKAFQEANWLQANEGEIDPSHLSYLHRYLSDEMDDDTSYGLDQFLDAAEGTDIPVTRILREKRNPQLEIETTSFGVRIFTLRDIGELMHVRVTNYLFPNAAVVAVGADWGLVQLHVPIDDEHNWRFDIMYGYRETMDQATLRRERLQTYTLPDYAPKRNLANRYGFDLEEQLTRTFVGIGHDINTQDSWAIEGAGPIQDRTLEHLGYTDKAIAASRRMLLQGVRDMNEGVALPNLVVDEGQNHFDHIVTIDTVSPVDEWRTAYVERHLSRRAESPWAAGCNASLLEALRLQTTGS
jgi:phenylpropionate dioxygenase-like ring-hydroxylating dioxygenase large terminal subunit